MSDEIVLLDIEGVYPPEDAARDVIDPEKIRELAESIRSQGLLQPILVRPHNTRFEVVAGHRRYLAHRLLGLVKIASIIRELDDEQTLVIRAIENDQREDLNPIEKAKVYRKLKDKFGWSPATIAQKMGRDDLTIRYHLKLLEIPEEFQKEVAKKRLPIGVALCLDQVEDPTFKAYFMRNAVDNGVTLEVAKMWVADYEKTKAGTFYNEGGGVGESPGVQESLPIYQTCFCCLGPEEVTKVKFVPLCSSCWGEVRARLVPQK